MFIQMKCFPSVGNSARLMCWTSVIWAHHVRTFNLSLSLQRELGLLPWGRGSAGESQHTSEYLKGGHREDGDRLCSVVAHTGPEEQALGTIWSPEAPSGHQATLMCCADDKVQAQRSRGCRVPQGPRNLARHRAEHSSRFSPLSRLWTNGHRGPFPPPPFCDSVIFAR